MTAGTDSDTSAAGHLAVKVPVKTMGALLGPQAPPNCPEGTSDLSNQAGSQKSAQPLKSAAGPKSGSKRKLSEL